MRRLVAMMAVMALLGAACGDDDDETEGAAGTTTTTEAGAESDDVAAYCKDSLAVETVPEPDIDFDSLSEDEQKEAAKKFVNEEFAPIVERLKESVPAEIEAPAQVVFDATDKVAADGDFEVFESEEVAAAEAELHAYDLANCGWESVEATGVEYAFQGVPATLEEGVTSFDFTNGGKELHEMIVMKKKDGVTESFDEILELEEDAAQAKVEEIAASFASQGESDYAVADLTKGDYLVVCFIPVGLTSQEAAPPENSPPHFVQGMKAEFKVA